MIYTQLTKKAMLIAYNAHKEQFDKSGVPYIFHPIHLAEQCENEYCCVVALLHDVVEDCKDYSFESLEAENFPKEIIDAVKLLTHDKNVPYLDYIRNIKSNEIATRVKLLDLNHNLDGTRFDNDISDEMKNKILNKHKLYKKAWNILTGND